MLAHPCYAQNDASIMYIGLEMIESVYNVEVLVLMHLKKSRKNAYRIAGYFQGVLIFAMFAGLS